MHPMRESWTDARLDDFAAHTDRRFDAVDRRFDTLERRMEDGFHRVDQRFEQVESRIDALHRTIHRTMLQLGGGLIVTVAIGFAGTVATGL